MKRSRPGVILSCLVPPEYASPVMEVLFRETTTLGVRIQQLVRQVLPRHFISAKVYGGIVRLKVSRVGIGQEKVSPEYADCKNIADRTARSLKDVMEEALLVYRQGQGKRRKATGKR